MVDNNVNGDLLILGMYKPTCRRDIRDLTWERQVYLAVLFPLVRPRKWVRQCARPRESAPR